MSRINIEKSREATCLSRSCTLEFPSSLYFWNVKPFSCATLERSNDRNWRSGKDEKVGSEYKVSRQHSTRSPGRWESGGDMTDVRDRGRENARWQVCAFFRKRAAPRRDSKVTRDRQIPGGYAACCLFSISPRAPKYSWQLDSYGPRTSSALLYTFRRFITFAIFRPRPAESC